MDFFRCFVWGYGCHGCSYGGDSIERRNTLGNFFEKVLTNWMNARPTWQTSTGALIKCVSTGVGIRSCTGTCIWQKKKRRRRRRRDRLGFLGRSFAFLQKIDCYFEDFAKPDTLSKDDDRWSLRQGFPVPSLLDRKTQRRFEVGSDRWTCRADFSKFYLKK